MPNDRRRGTAIENEGKGGEGRGSWMGDGGRGENLSRIQILMVENYRIGSPAGSGVGAFDERSDRRPKLLAK